MIEHPWLHSLHSSIIAFFFKYQKFMPTWRFHKIIVKQTSTSVRCVNWRHEHKHDRRRRTHLVAVYMLRFSESTLVVNTKRCVCREIMIQCENSSLINVKGKNIHAIRFFFALMLFHLLCFKHIRSYNLPLCSQISLFSTIPKQEEREKWNEINISSIRHHNPEHANYSRINTDRL